MQTSLRLLVTLCVIAVSLVFSAYMALAQEEDKPVVATWEVDLPPDGGWTAGDSIPLSLRVTYPAGMEITLPELPGQWGALEVRAQALQDPISNGDGALKVVREAEVTLWAPGEYQTPPFPVHYRDTVGELHEVSAPPLTLTVVSVLAEGDQDKRDLKQQASLPRPPLWPWLVAGVIAVAVLFVAARWLLSRWRQRQGGAVEAIEPVDDRLPEVIAYDELDRITALDLSAQGELKHHYTLVTACVRTYIEGIYAIPAMDRTTSELMTALHRVWVDGEPVALLRSLLEEANLVKFARLRPSIGDARASVSQARRFVDATKPDRTVAEGHGVETAAEAGGEGGHSP
jgi:hypothetical protein